MNKILFFYSEKDTIQVTLANVRVTLRKSKFFMG